MARRDFSFSYPLRVRWAEVDPQGVVFNGNYLTYFDVGVTELWRAHGVVYPQGVVDRFGVDFFVVKSVIEYHAPAHFDDLLEVCVRGGRIGRTSAQFLLEVHRGDRHVVSGELTYVCVDPRERRPVPVPDGLRALLTPAARGG